MTTLVFGGNGQVGQELLRALAPLGALRATTRKGVLPNGTPCEQSDFNAPDSLVAVLDRLRPARVVNAAAYTAVDRAEQEPEAAFRVNAESPAAIAQWCARHDVPLVHYSTDYVFDGRASVPYPVDAPTAPLGVYGQSKLAGEQAIRAAGGRHLIFRTAWVFSAHGHNFLRTMLRIGTEREELRVVADQVGTPTPASLIAEVTARALHLDDGGHSGTWHLTATGQTSWHRFAEEIFREAVALGLLVRAPTVRAITTAEYPTPARRPAYSCLDTRSLTDTFGVALPCWREATREVLTQLAASSARVQET